MAPPRRVPIWSASWELDCCQPEAEEGGRWSVPIHFTPRAGRLWEVVETPSFGGVDLAVSRTTRPEDPCPVFASGPLRFRGIADLRDGEHHGRLAVDAHASGSAAPDEAVTITGVVAAVDLVPLRYELVGDRAYHAVEELPPVRVRSTLDRRELDQLPEGASFVQSDLLVWLDVDG